MQDVRVGRTYNFSTKRLKCDSRGKFLPGTMVPHALSMIDYEAGCETAIPRGYTATFPYFQDGPTTKAIK